MKRLWKWIDHNQGSFVGLVLSVVLLVWTYGCTSTVSSLIHPEKKVTRSELQVELETSIANLDLQINNLQREATIKFDILDKQDALKQKLAEFALTTATTGQINPLGIVMLITGLAGIGLAVDNRAKDKVIKTNNKNNKV